MIKLPDIPHDKALHYIYGTLIALAVLEALLLFGIERGAAKALALAAAIVVGAVKEYVIDRRLNKLAAADSQPEPHTVSRGDVIATSLGGLVIWLA